MDRPLSARQELEVMQMLVEMSCGAAPDEQFARLDELVRTQPKLREFVVTGLTHLADCEWEIGPAESIGAVSLTIENSAVHRDATAISRPVCVYGGASAPRRQVAAGRSFGPWAGICASFVLGAAATYWFVSQGAKEIEVARPAEGQFALESDSPRRPVATLVRNTSHIWDAKESVAIEAGASLQAGQSVALFAGVADVQFQSGVMARIQGPAILSINSAGIPELKYGKCLVSNVNGDPFQFDVPAAEAFAKGASTLGIDAFGKEVVIHALKGRATVEPLDKHAESIVVLAGEAVRLLTTARSKLGVYKTDATPAAFDFDALAATQRLNAGREYADLVKAANPVAYWRFEGLDTNTLPNEMNRGHALRLLGEHVQFVESAGNGCAEFVVRDSSSCFVTKGPLDEIAGGDYSVEFWMNPGHFHRGAIVSLVEHASDEAGAIDRHGLIIELQSSSLILRPEEGRPKTLRYLHRSPPHESLVGTSCSSPQPYQIEVWQHVAAVKTGDVMQMYMDGRLVSSARDETHLPRNLSLVIGQLFSFGTVRPYVGRLDELAIYNRALSIDEIVRRVSLVRPKPRLDEE